MLARENGANVAATTRHVVAIVSTSDATDHSYSHAMSMVSTHPTPALIECGR